MLQASRGRSNFSDRSIIKEVAISGFRFSCFLFKLRKKAFWRQLLFLLWVLGCNIGPDSVEDMVGVTWVLSDSKSEHYWPSQKLFNVF